MTSIWIRTMAGLVLLFTVTVVGTIFSTTVRGSKALNVATQGDPQARKLGGTWRVQVAQRICQTGVVIRTFPATLTFAEGGTLVGTTTAFPPALRGPDHGIWQHTGDHTFSAVTEAFLFNPAGLWTGTQQITQTIEIKDNADEFNSNAAIQFFDSNGNVTLTGCATAVATRME